MKFLIDECVGPAVAQWLKQNNYDAVSIHDGITGIDDNAVLNRAVVENRILVTSDKDFGEMIFKHKMQHCGVLLLRLLDERPSNKINMLKNVLQNHSQDLPENFVVVTEKIIRIIRPSIN